MAQFTKDDAGGLRRLYQQANKIGDLDYVLEDCLAMIPYALDALQEAWDFLAECRATLLGHDESKDLKDLWWRLALYTDGLETAAGEGQGE